MNQLQDLLGVMISMGDMQEACEKRFNKELRKIEFRQKRAELSAKSHRKRTFRVLKSLGYDMRMVKKCPKVT